MSNSADIIRVLIVEDSEDDAFLLERALLDGGFAARTLRVDTEKGMKDALAAASWDAIIADYSLPSFSGLRALSIIKELDMDLPFILVSGTIGEEIAVEAMKSGAHDYIMKSHLGRLAPAVKREMEQAESRNGRKKALQTISEMNARLIKANEELRSVDEMKNNLLANVSHELRTPLVTIRGYNELIQTGSSGPVTPEQKKQLSISLRNIDRLMVMINNILEFSSLEINKETMSKDKMDLRQVLDEVWRIFIPRFKAKNIIHKFHTSTDPVFMKGDEAKLHMVFANLLDNAHKFTPPGGSVSMTMKEENGRIEIVVEDTGEGIPDSALRKVFDRFYQVDSSSTRKHGGVGIGLSISKSIIEKHGGVLAMQSHEGEGTVITVVFQSA
ncbi:MAG: hybrid sensor histidine kinase/response regulator [Fibrobacteres bacterium]|nr:hybrid sensor histidine kinase/response regulator [Fibrobacterota bacterium]